MDEEIMCLLKGKENHQKILRHLIKTYILGRSRMGFTYFREEQEEINKFN